MKPITNKKVENLINDKFNTFNAKANDILENITEIKDKEKLESLKYSNEIAEERIFNEIKEHRHISNMYWHPITRMHASITTKDKLPQGHVLYGEIQTRPKLQKPKDLEDKVSVIDKKFIFTKNYLEKLELTGLPEFKPIDFTINKDSSLYIRIDKIVRDFYDSFHDNSSLCLYYTYYLLKLKGNHDFDFDFRELENKLYNDFYNYGIFAIIKELNHFTDEFNLIEDSENSSIQLDDYIIYSRDISKIAFRKEFKETIIKISECTGISIEDIYKIIKISHIKDYIFDYKFKFQETDKEKWIVNNVKFLYLIEKYFGYLTNHDFILNIAIKAFNEIENKCFWSSEFGGNSWATIAKIMLNRNNMISKTIFVDTCWSLQHNTELFINKVYNLDKNIRLLENYLTDIKNGLFRNVYKCAVKHNKKLDRFIYKDIILENDANVSDARHTYKNYRQNNYIK